MLADKTPSRARRIAGASFIALALMSAGLAAWAQKPAVPIYAGGTVSVGKDGHVIWNGKTLEGKDAIVAQAKAQATSGEPHIKLSVAPATPYFAAGSVIQIAQMQGITDITFLPSGVKLNTPTTPKPGDNVPLPPSLMVIKPPVGGAAPSTSPKPPSDIPQPLRIGIDFDNTILLNGKPIDLTSLEQKFRDGAAMKIPPEVHIEPHRLATYANVERVLEAANKAGLTKMGILGGT